jgi:hypothetical protein
VNVRREGKQVYYTLNQQRIAAGSCTLAENYAPEQEIIRVPEKD